MINFKFYNLKQLCFVLYVKVKQLYFKKKGKTTSQNQILKNNYFLTSQNLL